MDPPKNVEEANTQTFELLSSREIFSGAVYENLPRYLPSTEDTMEKVADLWKMGNAMTVKPEMKSDQKKYSRYIHVMALLNRLIFAYDKWWAPAIDGNVLIIQKKDSTSIILPLFTEESKFFPLDSPFLRDNPGAKAKRLGSLYDSLMPALKPETAFMINETAENGIAVLTSTNERLSGHKIRLIEMLLRRLDDINYYFHPRLIKNLMEIPFTFFVGKEGEKEVVQTITHSKVRLSSLLNVIIIGKVTRNIYCICIGTGPVFRSVQRCLRRDCQLQHLPRSLRFSVFLVASSPYWQYKS